ncbi:retrovirus-related Pol polyprotein from transposon 17.6 [Trichonephila inaurata madagascariensis]|uniref:RNA-directed DNA polymerase n=1 Tax=Trichonephila inaurata madagascariensis TaxID=2747483 RepID=A0A8X6JP70_9ARAC|nr:retrovirus-related Pol polyprotein from transposon 17.6 [Trichonephila inaurata madagascariensis]
MAYLAKEEGTELAQVPKKDWVAYLLAVLPAELCNMLAREPTERANNYDFVKDLILKSSCRPKETPKDFKSKFQIKREPAHEKNHEKDFEKRRPLRCYECGSYSHLRPQCDKLKKTPESISHVVTDKSFDELMERYTSLGKVNGVEMKILRDTDATLDLICNKYVKPHMYTNEKVWLRTPLEESLICLPLDLDCEMGHVITKAAVLRDSLNQGRYFLGNKTAALLEDYKTKEDVKMHMINAVQTRAQKKLLEVENEIQGQSIEQFDEELNDDLSEDEKKTIEEVLPVVKELSVQDLITTSPMVFVEEQHKMEAPGKEARPCIDYRRLNKITRTKFFPLPNIEELIEKVSAKYISVLDLTRGYWQIPLSKNAQRYAAFVTNFGTFKPLRLPFGLKNAPYDFSRLMASILKDCEEYAVPYLDNVAIFSQTWEDHLKHLDDIFLRLSQGLRTPGELKVQVVKDFPIPTKKTQVRAFLGLAGYYRRYIPEFSVIAAPLTDLLKDRNRKSTFDWNSSCQNAFEELKTQGYLKIQSYTALTSQNPSSFSVMTPILE